MAKHAFTADELRQARKQARKLLQSPRFFNELLLALRKDGLVGEERNALIVFIVVVSRLLPHPLNLFVRGPSSTGKNWIVKRVLRLVPKDAYREITNTSDAAWSYSKDDFRHRVVYDQERDDTNRSARQMRLLISEDQLVRLVTQWVGGQRTIKKYIARGPVASISTTTQSQLQIDELTRHLGIFTDAGCDQTRQIVKQYTKQIDGLTREELRTWRTVQDLLKERSGTEITFPDWFDVVADGVFAEDVSVRRYYPAFVEACRTVSLIRSFLAHRKPKVNAELMVGFADYAITAIIFDHAFVQSLHRGHGSEEATRRLVERLAERESRGVSAKEVSDELGISMDRAYARLRRAEKVGVIQRENTPVKHNLKQFVPTARHRFVPDPGELFQKLKLKDSVCFVHPVTGKRVVYRRARA
jgi:hypothetical protein